MGKSDERRGLGHAMVAYVKYCCRRAGSHRLLIMSNRNRFWHHPHFRFELLHADDTMGLRRFDPWSAPCELLGVTLSSEESQIEGEVRAALATVRAREDGGSQCRKRIGSTGGRAGRSEQGGNGRVRSTPPSVASQPASPVARGSKGRKRSDSQLSEPHLGRRGAHGLLATAAQPTVRLTLGGVAGRGASGARAIAAGQEHMDDEVEVIEVDAADNGWVKLPLRCALTHQRLVEPARGALCRHPPLCNFADLRRVVGSLNMSRGDFQARGCPIMGCAARLKRTRDVLRDEALTQWLEQEVPAHVEAVWLARAEDNSGAGAAAGGWAQMRVERLIQR